MIVSNSGVLWNCPYGPPRSGPVMAAPDPGGTRNENRNQRQGVIIVSGRWDDPAVGRGPPAPAGRSPGRAGSQDVAALGQTVAARLFTAGLDLHFALMLIGEGPAARRCTRAIDELDSAIRQVRRLVLAVQEQSRGGRSPASGVPFRASGGTGMDDGADGSAVPGGFAVHVLHRGERDRRGFH